MAKKPADSDVTSIAAGRIALIAEDAPLDTKTLAGDVRDTLLDIFKTRPKAWSWMTEAEQGEIGRMLEYAARELVIGVVDVVRSDETDAPVKAILEGYVDKGDVKGTFKVKTLDEEDTGVAITTLHKMRGKLVLISMASHDDYLGERAPAEVNPDQTGLTFADDKPEFAEVDEPETAA